MTIPREGTGCARVRGSESTVKRSSTRAALREAAMERAGDVCEFPGCMRTDLEMAHIAASGMGGSLYRDVIDNVAMLCGPEGHHDWLDCRITPNVRRWNNEMILRATLDRVWQERR